MQRTKVTRKVTQVSEADEADRRTVLGHGEACGKSGKHLNLSCLRGQLSLNSSLLLLCGNVGILLVDLVIL